MVVRVALTAALTVLYRTLLYSIDHEIRALHLAGDASANRR